MKERDFNQVKEKGGVKGVDSLEIVVTNGRKGRKMTVRGEIFMYSLSIIVPAFNRADLLEICLGNLLAQVRPGDEIIVVDDASNDETQALLQEFTKTHPPIRTSRLQRNFGQGHARNHGASLAKNDLLVFVDSDIDIGKGNLNRIRSFFECTPQASAVTGRLSLKHPHLNFFSRYKNTYMNYIFGLQPERVNFLYGSICAIRKEYFIPWPEKFLGVEDSELGLKMTKLGHELYFMPDLEVIHFKNYTFLSLIKNDFFVPFGFARCFWLFRGWEAYLPWGERGFSHIKKGQVYSLIVVVLVIMAAISFSPLMIIVGLMIYLLLNRSFFLFLAKHEGMLFALYSFLWTFFDQFVMILGAVSGLIYHGHLLYMTGHDSGKESIDERR